MIHLLRDCQSNNIEKDMKVWSFFVNLNYREKHQQIMCKNKTIKDSFI